MPARFLTNMMRDIKNGSPSPQKARKILRDGEVRGKPLTDRQRRFMGARANPKG